MTKGFSLHNVQTGPEVHLASYPCTMGTGGCFPRSKVAGGMKLTTHFHPVLRLRMLEKIFLFPICLRNVVLNYLQPGDNFTFEWAI
jgi:hypothetical protein